MKTLLFILISISVAASAIAQNSKFVHSGSIEFEKRANIYAIRKKQITSENEIILLPKLEEYKQKNEQFKVSKSILYFDNNKSLYKPISDQSNDNEELFSSRNLFTFSNGFITVFLILSFSSSILALFSKNLLYLSSEINPTSCPISVSLKSALSCLSNSLYSALEVIIR